MGTARVVGAWDRQQLNNFINPAKRDRNNLIHMCTFQNSPGIGRGMHYKCSEKKVYFLKCQIRNTQNAFPIFLWSSKHWHWIHSDFEYFNLFL